MKKILISIIIILIIAGGWWYLNSKTEQINLPENVISGNIVSIVNKEEITVSEFELAQAQFIEIQNIDVASLDDETKSQIITQILDNLISQKLLQQAIKKDGTTVTQEEIAEQIEIVQSQFEDEESYKEALAEQGVTEEGLITQITMDMLTQKFLNQELSLESVTATDEEIEESYQQSILENEETPALADVYDQVETFVIGQKQQALINEFILELGEAADIEILI